MQRPESYITSFHSKQGQIVKSVLNKENTILVCGRGFGKSVGARGVAVIGAVNYKGYRPPQAVGKLYIAIGMPHLNQAKRIHWDSLEYAFTQTSLSRLVKSINKSEGIINLKGTLPGIILSGLNDDNGDKLRGLSIPYLILDEFQDIKQGIWSSVKPAVDRCGGSVLVMGTPKGRGTPFHKFMLDMTSKHNWNYKHYTTRDNPKIPNLEKVLRDAKEGLTAREYRAEYEASWEDFPGQIFDQITEENLIPLDYSPEGYDFCLLGVDWGDVNPALTVVGIKEVNGWFSYYVIETWEGNPEGGTTTILFDEVKDKALEFCRKYRIHSTFPDVFQPGNINFIWELSKLPHQGLKNIVEPGSADYARMRSLQVMPSCAQINRLLKQNRFFLNKNDEAFVDQFNAFRRKPDKLGGFLNEPDPTARKHRLDGVRYCVANTENNFIIAYGYEQREYSPFELTNIA